MIAIFNRYFEGGNSGEIDFDPQTGLFSYQIEGYQEDLREIFTPTMARNLIGFATLKELPKWLQVEAEQSLNCLDYAKAKMVSQTCHCDGHLMVSFNSL